MATVTILYPSGPDFDLEYYLDKHMAIVSEYVPYPTDPVRKLVY